MFRSNEINHKDNWRKVSRRTEEFTAQNAPAVADYEYTYSKGLHLIGKQENEENRRTAYQYDSYYRLRRVDYDCAYSSSDPTCIESRNNVFKCDSSETDCEDFQLDGVHNIRASRENQTNFAWTVDGFNRLTQKSWNNNTTTYVYDSNNNLISEDFDGDTNPEIVYTYDKLNRLTSVANSDYLVEYSYDPFNRRTEKTVYYADGNDTYEQTHKYAYDGWDMISEEIKTVRTSDNPATTTAWQLRRYVDQGTDNHIIMDTVSCSDDGNGNCSPNESTLQRIWFHKDERGNVIAVSDGNGTIYERYRYRVYGEHEVLNADFTAKSTAAVSPFLWGGSLYEPETNLYWMRNRYYHIDMHRFINQDPIGIWGDANNLGNGFAYVAGMVIEASDPSGLEKRIFIFREILTKFGSFGRLVVTENDKEIFTAYVFETIRDDNAPPFSKNVTFLGKIQRKRGNDMKEPYDYPRIRILEYDHIHIGRQIHHGSRPSSGHGCFLIASKVLNYNPNDKKDEIFNINDSVATLQKLIKLMKGESKNDEISKIRFKITIDPENDNTPQPEEKIKPDGGNYKKVPSDNNDKEVPSGNNDKETPATNNTQASPKNNKDGSKETDTNPYDADIILEYCFGCSSSNYPSDPDKDPSNTIQKILMNNLLVKILKRGESEQPPVFIDNSTGPNGAIMIYRNPYYVNKDPLKTILFDGDNGSGKPMIYRNPFTPGAGYGYDATTYEKFQQSGFPQTNVDPYWY